MAKPQPPVLYVPKKAIEYFSEEYFTILSKAMSGKAAWGYIPIFDDEANLKACLPDVDYDVVDARTFNVNHEELKVDKKISE